MSRQTAVKPASVLATFMRGGTSKARFFHEKDIPKPGQNRDDFLIRIMGSPDPAQIDGMGGSKIVTSKVAIIKPSARSDADVDFSFTQIGLGEATVSYSGNCGNISAAVGPFAINEGIVKNEPLSNGKRTVRIYNTGTDAILIAHVPIDETNGRALEKGDYAISGVQATGAPILMDYSQTAKARVILPTGNVVDRLECTFGTVEATFCEVGNPIVFIPAKSVGMQGNEMPADLDNNITTISRIREVRGRMAMKLGWCKDWEKVDEQSSMLPMVAAVSYPLSEQGNVQSRLFLDNRCHPTMAGTASVCTAATSRISGSVTNQYLSPNALQCKDFVIEHPAGYIPVTVQTENTETDNKLPKFTVLGFMRTARPLFKGELYIPSDIQEEVVPTLSTNTENSIPQRAADAAKNSGKAPVAVTTEFAKFVEHVQLHDISMEAQERLRQCLVDYIGVALLGSHEGDSSDAFVRGVEAVTRDCGSESHNRVIGRDLRLPKQYAALLTGAFSHTPDFDDTHSGGIIHVAATVLSVALTEAQGMQNLTYSEFITAMAVGYEVSCRIAIALGVSSWRRGFHNTSIAGIFGGVAALSRLRGLSQEEIENAFGLAGSFASGSMQYLQNGAWNKRLHPAKAAHDAFIVVAMAQAGVIGAAEPIEGKFGLIKAHTDTPESQVNVDDLGKRWELVNTALKPYPGCRATHPVIELAALLSQANPGVEVQSVHISMDPSTYPMVADPIPNKIHPRDIVDAQFSAYYQTAAAWFFGDATGWKIYHQITNSEVQALCERITIDSVQMHNNLACSMSAVWADGTNKEMTLEYPKWEQPQRPPQNAEVAVNFRSLAADIIGKDEVEKIINFATGPLDAPFSDLLSSLYGISKE